ncbi:MAG: CAP domain-containing protein [Lachnospiraceae bacterium]|nr:CAP domain-containing protein [Lachnospiraceae bacterium]
MKRTMTGILILGLCMSCFCGCTSTEGNTQDETTVIETETLGELEGDVEADTADTTAPEVQWNSDVLFTNSLSGQAAADLLSYNDESDCTVELTRFTKLSNLEVLDDSKLQSYTAGLNQVAADELLARTPNKAAGEGIYSAVLSVTDAAGNTSAHEVLVVYDKTAPIIEGLADQTIVQADPSVEPAVDLSALKISDNVDGVIDAARIQTSLDLEEEATRSYTFHISIADRCGNEAIDYCKITVTAETKEEAKPAQEQTAASNATQESSKKQTEQTQTATNAGQETEQAKPQEQISYQTTTTFQMADGTAFQDAMAKEVLTILNQRRAESGLAALTWDDNLTTVAKVRSLEIVGNFSHTRPDGRSFYTAIDDQHIAYTWGGENLACGQTSAEVAMSEWMASQSHKDNILRGEFKKVGIACYYDPNTTYKYYWVQIFSD